MRTLMFDVDGVLADFTLGFTKLGKKLFEGPVYGTMGTPDYPNRFWHEFDGYTKDQVRAMWKFVDAAPKFWEGLDRLVDMSTMIRICNLMRKNEVVFVTARICEARPPGEQTKRWLRNHGIPNATVVVSSSKAMMSEATEASFSIEDRLENAVGIGRVGHTSEVNTQSYLINRPYNQPRGFRDEALPIKRVDTVEQFLDVVEEK